MIPVLLVLGIVAGLLGRAAMFVLLAAVAWPLLLILTGVDSGLEFALAAAALGSVNAAVGALTGLVARTIVVSIKRSGL